MTKILIILSVCFGVLACQEKNPFRENSTLIPVDGPQTTPTPPDDVPQKPTDSDTAANKSPLIFYQTFVNSSKADAAKVSDVCPQPPEFEIDGVCKEPLKFCKRNDEHIYQCRNRTIRITGKVIDADTKEPIVGARVAGYMMMLGEMGGVAFTDKDGDYVINSSSLCPHMVIVNADQHYWQTDWFFAQGAVRCKAEEYGGSSGTVVEMKKLPRTIGNEGQLSTDKSCHFVGYVKDEQDMPLSDVTVNCEGRSDSLLTNSHGLYTFHSDEKSCPNYCFSRKDGYKGKIHGITNSVNSAGASPADMILVKE